MYKNYINRNSFLFVLITVLSIGGIIVYAMNNMDDSKNNSATTTLGNKTQAAQKTAQPDKQTIQNFDINNQADEETSEVTPGSAESSASSPTPTTVPATPTTAQITEVKELKITDITTGTGNAVKKGDKVEVNYLGTFLNGQKFDSSYDRNQTFSFTVGAGNVIKGWDQGLIGMKVGGKRELLIPSDLAYGASGVPGSIPPNTPLKFEIELIKIN